MRSLVVAACALLVVLSLAGIAVATPAGGGGSLSPSPAVASDGPPPVTVAQGADDAWHNQAVTVTFSATSEVSTVAATYVQVDGGSAAATTEVEVKAPSDHSGDGQHILTFWSVDTAGRTETPQAVTVKIDTRPPAVRGLKLGPDVLHRVQPFRISFSMTDLSGGAHLAYEVDDQYGYLARKDRGIDVATGTTALDLKDRYGSGKPWVPGLFRVTLTLVDKAGNRETLKPLLVRDYHPTHASITYNVKGVGKRVALTFDDGGPAYVWARMLDVLKAYHMHASFFVIGPYVRAEQRVAARAAREGHGIGSHGWTHTAMTTQSVDAVRHELISSEAPWWSAARVTPVGWMRPPYGDHNASTVAAAGSAGFAHVILWDVDPGDWRGYGASTIAANTLSHVHSGAIIGLHVRSTTAAALPTILRGLKARGYTSVSLPELFHDAGKH
jgi:peptidoglycan/xylan/chitin deacetylase (PgdA/CDA1 family)